MGDMNCRLERNRRAEWKIRIEMKTRGSSVMLLRALGDLYVRDTQEDIDEAYRAAGMED